MTLIRAPGRLDRPGIEIAVERQIKDTVLLYLDVIDERYENEMWHLSIDARTVERLEEERYPNESHNDCIARLAQKRDVVSLLQPAYRRFQMTEGEAIAFGPVKLIMPVTGYKRHNRKRDRFNQLWWVEATIEKALEIEAARKKTLRKEKLDTEKLVSGPPNEITRPIGEALVKALMLYIQRREILNPSWPPKILLKEVTALTGRMFKKHDEALEALRSWLALAPERKKFF